MLLKLKNLYKNIKLKFIFDIVHLFFSVDCSPLQYLLLHDSYSMLGRPKLFFIHFITHSIFLIFQHHLHRICQVFLCLIFTNFAECQLHHYFCLNLNQLALVFSFVQDKFSDVSSFLKQGYCYGKYDTVAKFISFQGLI